VNSGNVISPERTLVSVSKLCSIYRLQEGNMSGQYLCNRTVPTTGQPTQVAHFCQRYEVWELEETVTMRAAEMKSVGGADSQHRWQQVNKWLSTPTYHQVSTWQRTPNTNVNNGCATEHAHKNRNGVTAFTVTCTILGAHQLLGKIQKEMLFRKFGSTGRKVLSLKKKVYV